LTTTVKRRGPDPTVTRQDRNDTTHRYLAPPRLGTAFISATLIFGIIAALVVIGPIARYGRAFQAEVQSENALRGAEALEVAISRAIEREWDSLEAVAAGASRGDLDEMRRFANAVLNAGGRIAWAGFADGSGIIRAGARGAREGEDVGERRWFREGLAGGSIGNVYRPTGPRPGAPETETLINLSTPVRAPNGETLGVFAYSLRMQWLADYLDSTAEELDLDAFILNRDGEIVAERRAAPDGDLPADAFTSLQLNRTHATVVENPRGPDEVLAVVPDIGTEAMPSLNWSLLVRLPAISPSNASHSLTTTILTSLALLFTLLAVFTMIFNRHFLSPFSKLAAISGAIADGQEIYPEEFRSTRESAALSRALSRIQTKLP